MELENNVEKNVITLKKYVNRLKKREGITFLVLVTMIILFLIILSITLPPIISNNGIIASSKMGVNKKERQDIEDVLRVLSFEIIANENIKNLTATTFKTKLEEKLFRYNEDIVILVCDEAVWHKSKNLEYDIRTDIGINYTKDGKGYKVIVERY